MGRFTIKSGVTVTALAIVTFPAAALTVTGMVAEGLVVDTENVAVVAPAGTVTDDGHWRAVGFDEVRLTTVPRDGAAWSSVTVPVAEPPPVIVEGKTPRVVGSALAAA